MGIKGILYRSLILTNIIIAFYFLVSTTIFSWDNPVDFPIFYGAARNALDGLPIYTYYSILHLPFWYLPWTSWIFIPLVIFPFGTARIIYLVISLSVAFLALNAIADQITRFSIFDRLYMFSMLLWMSWQAYRVGQISYLLLGAVVLVILLTEKKSSILTGLLFPILLIKPHLFILFIPLVLWLGGKKALLTSTLVTLFLLGIETLITPDWYRQMLGLLLEGTSRVDPSPFWDFSTFPTLLGFSQNFSGSANLPFTLVLVAIAAFVVIRFRSLPRIPLLSLALAASLFCAPRSYAYDLVFLIPAMIWLSEKWSLKTALLWTLCAIIPLLSHFSAGSYIVTLIVFSLSIYKAYTIEIQGGRFSSLLGKGMNVAC